MMHTKTEAERNTVRILLALLVLCVGSCSESDTVCLGPTDSKPPTVEITSPVGDTLYTPEALLSADVSDEAAIDAVSFYVDDLCVAVDGESPYEQVWYAGYWDPDETYSIVIKAEDEHGNVGASPPREIVLAGGTTYQPVILEPENMAIFRILSESTEILVSWEPVPGARGYQFRYRLEGFLEIDHIFLSLTEPSLLFQVIGFLYPDEMLRVYWSVQAQWDSEHKSLWSSERWFQLIPDIGTLDRPATSNEWASAIKTIHLR